MDPLEFIRPITWGEVSQIWREGEEINPAWVELYRSRGYESWETWRGATHKNLKPETLSWKLYRIIDPVKTIPTFRGGPFKSWKRAHYGGRDSMPFAELAARSEIQQNGKALELLRSFPKETMLTGVKTSNGNIFIVEGMHRACAVALAAQQDKSISSDITLALTEWPEKRLPELGIG